jgi:hypothetical protein
MRVLAGRKRAVRHRRRPATRRCLPRLTPVTSSYHLHHLYLSFALTIRCMCLHSPMAE